MSLAFCGVLLLLVLVRQLVISVQQERLRRERETAQVSATILRQTLEQMDEFLATAAHDLRTPMGAVVGYLDLASRDGDRLLAVPDVAAVSPELVERIRRLDGYVEEASKGALRTTEVLNRILAAAQVHADQLELHPEPCDLSRVVGEQVAWMRVLHPSRPFALHVSRPPGDGPLSVLADPVAIGQVVENYLTNAVKYSAEDDPIEVRVTTQGQSARVEVQDHGSGVPPWEQARIWERYYRAPGTTVRTGTNVGLGIGLHICKLIVTKSGGQVGVQSVPGQGSTFWFSLPLLDH
jgi:signal transduction histidine kinase